MADRGVQTGLTVDRLQALSDGVIAIVVTILILGIEVPPPDETGDVELHKRLAEDWIMFVGYVVSFMLISLYWLIHHALFHYFVSSNRTLSILNLLFLMFIAFIPFPTNFLIAYPGEQLAAQLYAVSHILTSLSLAALWIYGSAGCRLVDPRLDPGLSSAMTRRLLIGPAIYSLALAIAFFDPWIAKAIFLVVPLVCFLPSESDTH